MNTVQISGRRWDRLIAILTLIACSTLLPGSPRAAVNGDASVLTLQDAVATAVDQNPGLDELRQRMEAAAAVPSQVGSLPDPRISLGAVNVPVDTFAFDQEPMTQVLVGVTQPLPFPGKLGLRRQLAESEAAAAVDSMQEARLRLVRDVRSSWWELF